MIESTENIKNFKQKKIKAIFEELESYFDSTVCYLCNKKIKSHVRNLKKVHDHGQFTGKYQGSKHSTHL